MSHPRGGGVRQSAEASLAVEAVMEAFRAGALGRAVLYEVAAEGEGGKNLKECAKDADGKVKGAASSGTGQDGGHGTVISLIRVCLCRANPEAYEG